jgi:hypothetical protein
MPELVADVDMNVALLERFDHEHPPRTWREEIQDAYDAINRASDHRRGVLQAAYTAGVSSSEIASVMGYSRASVTKVIGPQLDARPGVDDRPSPATTSRYLEHINPQLTRSVEEEGQ